jgi:hypothetical protein
MSASAFWLGLEGSAKLAKRPSEGKLVSGHESDTENSRRKTPDEDNATQLSDGIIGREDGIVKQTAADGSSASRSLAVENATKPGAVHCHPRGRSGSVNVSLSSSSSSSSFETLEEQQTEVANVTAPLEGFLDPPSPTAKAIPVDQSQLRCRRSFFSRFVDAGSSSNLVYKRYSESELEDCQDNTEGSVAVSSTCHTTLMESLVVSLDRSNGPPGCSPLGAPTEQIAITKSLDAGRIFLPNSCTDLEPPRKLPLALAAREDTAGFPHVTERSNRDDSPTAAVVPSTTAPAPESHSLLLIPLSADEAALATAAASTIVAFPVDPIDIVSERQLILVRQGRRSRNRYLWRVMVQCGGLCMVLLLLGGICFAIACAISKSKCLAL